MKQLRTKNEGCGSVMSLPSDIPSKWTSTRIYASFAESVSELSSGFDGRGRGAPPGKRRPVFRSSAQRVLLPPRAKNPATRRGTPPPPRSTAAGRPGGGAGGGRG